MKSVILAICLLAVSGCARPLDTDSNKPKQQAGKPAAPEGLATGQASKGGSPKPGPMAFPTFSKEKVESFKELKPGPALPLKIERDYLVLRGNGLRIGRGDYYVRRLAAQDGTYSQIMLSKKESTSPSDVDVEKATAKDGSFAEILDVVAMPTFPTAFPDTKVYISASGESGSIWLHFKNEKTEYRAELFGLAGPESGLKKTQ